MMWRVWSSDALLRKYGLEGKDSALDRVALIVRGADTAAKDLTPESRGLDAIAGGFQRMEISDPEELEWEFPLYDALYVYCGGGGPSPGLLRVSERECLGSGRRRARRLRQ
jgi:hypothetical protein